LACTNRPTRPVADHAARLFSCSPYLCGRYGDLHRIRRDCLECRPCNTCRRCSHTCTRYRYQEYCRGYGCIDAPSRRRDVTDEKLLLWLDVGDRGTDEIGRAHV